MGVQHGQPGTEVCKTREYPPSPSEQTSPPTPGGGEGVYKEGSYYEESSTTAGSFSIREDTGRQEECIQRGDPGGTLQEVFPKNWGAWERISCWIPQQCS